MRGITRGLSGSQVSDWHGRPLAHFPANRPRVQMIDRARANAASGVTTASVTHGAALPGDLILVMAIAEIGVYDTGISVSASGLTFTAAALPGTDTGAIGIWWAVAPDTTARSVTCTVTNTSTRGFGFFVYVLRGAATSHPVRASGTFDSFTSSVSSRTVPSFYVPPGGLALALVNTSDANTLSSPTSGWTTTTATGTLYAHLAAHRSVDGPSGDFVVNLDTNGPDRASYCYAAVAPAGV